MGWVLLAERIPPKEGGYQVVKFHKGTQGSEGFFKPIPPWKTIEYMTWKKCLKIESDYADRCVYLKYYCFLSDFGIDQDQSEILYWFELDAIPEE